MFVSTDQHSSQASTASTLPLHTAWLVLVVVVLADIMDLIDSSVANLAGPSIRADLGGGQVTVQWVLSAYTAAFALGLVTSGRLGDLLGRRRLFLLGVAGFTVASPLQVRVMEQAPHAPTLVSAALQSAFNTSNSLGAYLGGVVIAAGFGYASPNLVGVGLAVVGLMFAAVSAVLARRSRFNHPDDRRNGSGRTSDTAASPAANAAVAR